ncbi:MAG: hypothetical protein H6700_08480 [Myxococcales bacterium]|nr:hypothetical protein [Myxococcales bacterium]MCB9531785.1 hypothetical protein [Myxococcales bacterium]
MSRWTVIVAIVAGLLAGCNRHAPTPESTQEPAVVDGSSPEAVAEVAPAVPVPPTPPPIPAARPDALAAPLGDAAVTVLVDAAALRAWTARAGWDASSGAAVDTWLASAVADAAPLTASAQDGARDPIRFSASPARVAIGLTEGVSSTLVADAPIVAPIGVVDDAGDGLQRLRLAPPTPDDGSGAAAVADGPTEANATLLAALPADAMVTVLVPSLERAPATARDAISAIAEAGATGFGVALRPDGSMVGAIAAADEAAVRRALGRGQAFVSMALGQLRGDASPELGGWVTYLNRATQALFARVSVEAEPWGVALTIPPPTCGGPMRNLTAAALVFGAAEWASRDPAARPAEYVAMDAQLAEGCPAMPGPPATLPGRYARLADAPSDVRSTLIVVDLAATLRAGLPTGFGLLPFALDPAAIDSMFGARPMGWSGLDATDAHLAVAMERLDGSTAPPRMGALMPAATAALFGEGSIDRMTPTAPVGVEAGFATPGFDLAARMSAEGSDVLPAADGAVAAVWLGPAFLTHWALRTPSEASLRPVLERATGLVIALLPSGRVRATLVGAGLDGALEAKLALTDGAVALASSSGSGNPVTPAQIGERVAALSRALDALDINTRDGDLVVEGPLTSAPVLAALIRIGLPSLAGLSGRGHIPLPLPPNAGTPFRPASAPPQPSRTTGP